MVGVKNQDRLKLFAVLVGISVHVSDLPLNRFSWLGVFHGHRPSERI